MSMFASVEKLKYKSENIFMCYTRRLLTEMTKSTTISLIIPHLLGSLKLPVQTLTYFNFVLLIHI